MLTNDCLLGQALLDLACVKVYNLVTTCWRILCPSPPILYEIFYGNYNNMRFLTFFITCLYIENCIMEDCCCSYITTKIGRTTHLKMQLLATLLNLLCRIYHATYIDALHLPICEFVEVHCVRGRPCLDNQRRFYQGKNGNN